MLFVIGLFVRNIVNIILRIIIQSFSNKKRTLTKKPITMKRITLCLLFLAFSFITFAQFQLSKGFIQAAHEEEDFDERAFTYQNLKIYPLIAGEEFIRSNADVGNYTNLQEALESDKVEIIESGRLPRENTNENDTRHEPVRRFVMPWFNNNEDVSYEQRVEQLDNYELQQHENAVIQQNVQVQGGGDRVNTLYIKNHSEDTVFLMAGEVIRGGKQDRVLAKDMIIPPNSDYIDLSVFCVEKNRWHYKSSNPDKFDAYFMVGSNSVRYKATKEKSQSAVWSAVDKVTTKNDAATSTGTYAALGESEKFQNALLDYSIYFDHAFAGIENCIGFVGVSGDKILGCDIFATPALFAKQRKNLLNAYITDAITDGGEVTISDEEVMDYLREFLADESTQESVLEERGVMFKHKNKKIHIISY